MLRLTLITSFLAVLQACTLPLQPATQGLPEPVLAALQKAQVPPEHMAVVVEPASAGSAAAPRLAHRAALPMQPGSTMKLLTSAVALDTLGAQHRGHTALLSAAPLQGDVLMGELVLQGGADPEFGIPQLWALLQELRFQGVRELRGNLIVDRTLYRPARMDVGVPPFDSGPEFEYNVIPDALHLNASLLPLALRSDAHRLNVRSWPELPGLRFDASAMALSPRPCREWGALWQTPITEMQGNETVVRLRGEFPADCERRMSLQVLDRQALTERLVRVLWQQMGGTWVGAAVEAAAPSGARVLARREARPWGELLRHLNKASDNAWSRILFLNLGVAGMAAQPQASTLELARERAMQWWLAQGLPADGLVLDNGSGLSRTERISAQQMAALLQWVLTRQWASDFVMSLPVPGVDGTLRRRMADGPAHGRARLKTGTLSNTRALAGYVTDVHGRQWVLAAMVNTAEAGRATPALDALVQWVASGAMQPLP